MNHFICVLTDCLARNQTSTTVLPDKPQGVADAAELLLVGLPFEDGGHGVLARVSGPVAGSELVNELSLGIWVGGISSEHWLLSGGHRGFPGRERQGG